jgi:hypothetical protein
LALAFWCDLRSSSTHPSGVCRCVVSWCLRVIASAFLRFGLLLAVLCCGPQDRVSGPGLEAADIRPFHCYPYFCVMRDVVRGRKHCPALAQINYAKCIKDGIRMLYLYGEDKNTFWHDEKALSAIRPHVVPVQNAGHWLYKHQPEVCLAAIRNFIYYDRTKKIN